MRAASLWVVVLIVGCGLCALVQGCSGTGSPAVPKPLQALITTANNQVTAALLTRRWFVILYPYYPPAEPGTCKTSWKPLPPQPGDPPGSLRLEFHESDCAVVTVFQLKDGSGNQTTRLPDGHEKYMTFGPIRYEGSWAKQDLEETYWDGAKLQCEIGGDHASPRFDGYQMGSLALPDGRVTKFTHHRNLDLDTVELQPSAGDHLSVQVPLTKNADRYYVPIFSQGAPGTYADPQGAQCTFKVTGVDNSGWNRWELTAPGGFTGAFTLAADFSGSGLITHNGQVAAYLSWLPTGMGRLDPTMAEAVGVTASAAARDFQLDGWIRNIAALGPCPQY